jgi:aryl-alcohol dehydrogenase-like predicted oxidoreductase
MEKRKFGKTGLEVTRLGVGLSEIGSRYHLGEAGNAGKLLNLALDEGINFLDTSACYGTSEELIGRTISHRRSEYVLSTKCGHVTGGYAGSEWSAQTILDSIERSLSRMQTDHLDIVHLHSCGLEILQRGEAIRALQDARDAGKTRFIGYSGDNDAAAWAVNSGLFDSLQTSFNLVDQRARTNLFPLAVEKGMGIIIKRPIANAAWGRLKSPSGYAYTYWQRSRQIEKQGGLLGAPRDGVALALAFVLAHPQPDTLIIGTADVRHMGENIELMNNLQPLSTAIVEELHRRFEILDSGWEQQQ